MHGYRGCMVKCCVHGYRGCMVTGDVVCMVIGGVWLQGM